MRYGIVTVDTYIDCGLRLQIGAVRTLRLYRDSGGRIRTGAFLELWRAAEKRFEPTQAAAV